MIIATKAIIEKALSPYLYMVGDERYILKKDIKQITFTLLESYSNGYCSKRQKADGRILFSVNSASTQKIYCSIWDPAEELVIIRRDMPSDPVTYCSALIHELTHADTGRQDIDRAFETALSSWIGYFAWKAINKKSE